MPWPPPCSCSMPSVRMIVRRCRFRPSLSVLAATLLLACGPSADGPSVRVKIPAGASFAAAADSLARAGVIGSPRLFRIWASATGRDRSLQPGTYMLRQGASWGDLIENLTSGRSIVVSVTIPEGYDIASITRTLTRALAIPADSMAAAVSDTSLRRRLGIPDDVVTIEGYLFPETYVFGNGTDAREAVETMVGQFEKEWRPEWTARLDTLRMTRNEVMALASIVEKEAVVAEERPIIAAVYRNRLQRGMLLQADPTVQYALGERVDRVLYKHLEVESRYNTYRHAGLPPGPIASPGAASIIAALYPADVPYLYFVARPDGHHEFRRTFAEHTAAIRQIRRERSTLREPAR